MIQRLFSIRDVKVEAFFPPLVQQNAIQAQRTFLDLLKDERLEFHKHPEDYILYEVGAFNTETGEVTGVMAKVVLVGSEVKDAA